MTSNNLDKPVVIILVENINAKYQNMIAITANIKTNSDKQKGIYLSIYLSIYLENV